MKRMVIGLLLANVALPILAQRDYHAEVLFDLTGPVKECIIETRNPLTFLPRKIEFQPDGQTAIPFEYNDKGYPVSINTEFNGKTVMKMEVEYDAQNLPVEMKVEMNTFADMKMDIFNTFDNGVLTESKFVPDVKVLNVPADTGIVMTYTYLDRDDHGNWTSREIRIGGTVEDATTYKETRTISYY